MVIGPGTLDVNVDNYQEWVGATITVLGENVSTNLINIPVTVDPITVPEYSGLLTLTITEGISGADLIAGIVNFTLPNGCHTSAGYFIFGP
jgi:hypothetical protein